jgi:hypothetical protein
MLVEFFRTLGFEINDPEQFLFNGTLLFSPVVFGVLAGAAKTRHHWTNFTYLWPKVARILYAAVGVGLLFFFSWAGCIP